MSERLPDDDLAAMIARDNSAGDGLSTRDDLVYTDRHLLIVEVQRLRELVARLQTGRPTFTAQIVDIR
jgi:hypothetical protein